jgi:hypothetical protein
MLTKHLQFDSLVNFFNCLIKTNTVVAYLYLNNFTVVVVIVVVIMTHTWPRWSA